MAIARVQRRLPGDEMTEVEVHMVSYSLFVTDHQRQVAHRQPNFDHDGLSGRFRTVRAMPKRHLWASEIQLMS